MLKNFVALLIGVLLTIVLLIHSAFAATSLDLSEEKNIYQKVYDASIELTTGEQTSVHQLAARKPLIIALIFTRCSGVCSPLIQHLKEQIEETGKHGEFTALVLSFDPRDSAEDMKNMAERFELQDNPDFIFATTKDIDSLCSSLAFFPVWNEDIQQFEHDALLGGVNLQGFITKRLLGLRDLKDMKIMIASINNKFVPTYRLPTSSDLFSCFTYDPITGKNKPGKGLIFLVGPVFLSIFAVFSIWMVGRRRRVIS